MPALFNRSMSTLEADSFRHSITSIVLAAVLLSLWLAWFFLSRIHVYEVTDRARIEVKLAVHPIQASIAGRIVANRLALDKEVATNEVVVELDGEIQRRRLDEQHARAATLSAQSRVLRTELLTEEQVARDEVEVGRAAIEKARARVREALAAEDFAAQKAERMARAHARLLITEIEYLEAKAESVKQRAAADTQREEVRRLEKDEQKKASERKARIERLKREFTRIDGEIGVATAEIRRLEYEVDKLRIRAPVAGRIGEVANLRVGSVVSEGEHLGSVVPRGAMRVVANFPPYAAIGRIRPGQPGRLRLHGYPWTQYGAVGVMVDKVASEVRDGTVRVDLAIRENSPPAIPIQHGLPGTVEVEVESASPARLFLRAAGELIAAPVSTLTSKLSIRN